MKWRIDGLLGYGVVNEWEDFMIIVSALETKKMKQEKEVVRDALDVSNLKHFKTSTWERGRAWCRSIDLHIISLGVSGFDLLPSGVPQVKKKKLRTEPREIVTFENVLGLDFIATKYMNYGWNK